MISLGKAAPAASRVRLTIFLGLLSVLLASAFLPFWTDASHAIFDRASMLSPPRPAVPGYVIVAIDEPSFSAVGKPWPWPRALHAQLIRALKAAGARVVALDIVFAEPTDKANDGALAHALGPSTILASDETLQDSPEGVMLLRTAPLDSLLRNGARVGVTSVPIDSDGVVRQIPRYPDSFPRQMLRLAGVAPPDPGKSWIQYFGPPGSYPTVSYYQALDPSRYLPPGYFKGRDVIVGFALQATADANKGTDMFKTSSGAMSSRLTPGAEIHATVADNLRDRLWIVAGPRWVAFAMLLVGAGLGLVAAASANLARRWAAVAALALAIVAGAWLTLRFGRVWISPAEPLVALGTIFAGLGLADFAIEQQGRRRIHAAFGQYLAPVLVDRLAADPGLVKLRGERKEMTILFADVRGFTSISDTMKDRPEELTALINQILEPLSDAILKHGGTIDKYVGDCVMAFWNAPIDDPDHASHAVAAALDMIEALPGLNHQLSADGGDLPEGGIAIGIGINSGECVVGNMGTKARFNYTVVGDAVNIASRLEGLSKEYGAPIIIGEAAVALAGARFEFRELDTVTVRGAHRSQLIYTVAGRRLGDGGEG